MPSLSITPNLDLKPWTDLRDEIDAQSYDGSVATIERVGLLPGGMVSGDPAFEIVVQLADGTRIVAETSWRLMRNAVHALEVSPIAPKLADRP